MVEYYGRYNNKKKWLPSPLVRFLLEQDIKAYYTMLVSPSQNDEVVSSATQLTLSDPSN